MKFLDQFIKRGDALGRLHVAAKQFDALARRLRRILPDEAASHVSGCAVRAATLVVFVDSAIWSSSLRYRQNEILSLARQFLGVNLQKVQFKVLPAQPSPTSPTATAISPGSRQLLRQAASGIPDDELAGALRRLARDQDAD